MDYYHFLISFDIRNDKRRRKITKILLNYAYRVQYSVFEMRTKSLSLKEELAGKIKKIIAEEDSVMIYELDALDWNKRTVLGRMPDESALLDKKYVVI